MSISMKLIKTFMFLCFIAFICVSNSTTAQESAKLITGEGEGWVALTETDFQNVNTDPDTWIWKDGTIFCKGTPVGVTRSKKKYTNFEMVATWRHMKHAGNSGIFLWASEDGLEGLKPGQLPKAGIEVQILDHGYAENYEKANNNQNLIWLSCLSAFKRPPSRPKKQGATRAPRGSGGRVSRHCGTPVLRYWEEPPPYLTLFATSSSTTAGSASVLVSPSPSTSFAAILRKIRRMILPERVFGRPGAH